METRTTVMPRACANAANRRPDTAFLQKVSGLRAIGALDRAGIPWLRCIKREKHARRFNGVGMGGVA